MKIKHKIATLLLLSVLTSSALLAMPSKLNRFNNEPKETETTIKNYFKFPQILIPYYESKKDTSQKVEVLFTTDKNGRVNFVLAKTQDQALKHEIEKQFSCLRLSKLKQNTVHSVVLNFKIL